MTFRSEPQTTPTMQPSDLGFHYCNHGQAYSQNCKATVQDGHRFCERHRKPCGVCGEPSTWECNFCGQFVCGMPLCDNCTDGTDKTKSSGSWGFMNHIHVRKPNAPPIHKMVEGDLYAEK